MKAEIITIGDEILIGQIVDTNSAWIAEKLNESGFTVIRKATVGDDRGEILRAVREGLSECDVVITTGGLGPTRDDITKTTLAEYFGCPIVRSDEVYAMNERMLAERGIEYNELNQGQAMVPECCTLLLNHNGTAPGMWFEQDGRVLVSLPGVPFEMQELLTDSVISRLRKHFRLRAVIHKTVVTFGLAESVLAKTIAEWESALPQWLHLAYLPNPSHIRLRLSAYDVEGIDEAAEIDNRFSVLERIIPEYIIGYGDESVASATAQLLRAKKATLAVAESCTGGAVTASFTAIPGASDYLLGSVVSYSNAVKAEVLGVSEEDLRRYGAVSREVAEQMAAGIRRLCKSDYAISTTGIAGPDGGTPGKPVGTVWIAAAGPDGIVSRKFVFGKLRKQNIERASATSINMLRLILGYQNVFINEGVL